MPDFAVKTIFNAAGNMISQMQKMTVGATLFGDKASKAFQKASHQGSILKGVMGGLAGYLSARMILKFANDSIKAYQQTAEASANAAATIKSTNGIAGKTLADLEAQAAAFQNNTFFGDDEIIKNVSSQMLTFTNITGKQFDRAQQSVLDVTAKLYGLQASGENLKGTTIQLSKALNDVRGMAALRKSGIMFTKEQETLAKRLYNTGRIAEYQNLVLTEIEKQYGGTAAALAQTSGGVELQTKNVVNDIQEVIGKGLAPLKLGLLTFGRDIMQKAIPIIDKLGVVVEKLLPPFMELLDTVGYLFNTVFDTALTIISGFTGKTIKLEDVLDGIGGVIKFISKIIKYFANGLKVVLPFLTPLIILIGILTAVWWGFNIAMSANPIGLIIIAIAALTTIIGYLITNWDKVSKKISEQLDKWKGLISFLGGPVIAILTTIIEIISAISRSWDKVTEAFNNGDILGGIMRIGGAIMSGILSPIQSLLELLSNIPGLGDLKGAANYIQAMRAAYEGDTKKANELLTPNKNEAEARVINFNGQLNIAGAPSGSTVTSKTKGAPNIKMNMLGAN